MASSKESKKSKTNASHLSTLISNYREPIIQHFVSSLNIKTSDNPNVDYGGHSSLLNFPIEDLLESQRNSRSKETIPGEERLKLWQQGHYIHPDSQKLIIPKGSHSFGLVLDNRGENEDSDTLRPLPLNSRKEKHEILKSIKDTIYKTMKHRNNNNFDNPIMQKNEFECLRMNVITNANTKPHTDSIRHHLLPNFAVFYSPYNVNHTDAFGKPRQCKFSIQIKNWPLFTTSIVKLGDQMLIPFEYEEGNEDEDFDYSKGKGGFLKTITLNKEGKAIWYILPPKKLKDLKPYKVFKKGFAVIGIKAGKVYYVKRKDYQVCRQWDEVKTMKLDYLFNNSPSFEDDIKPRYEYTFLRRFNFIHQFNGWQKIHSVDTANSDLETIRLHFFFRNIRTIGICQQARPSSTSVVIYNEELEGNGDHE